MSDKEKKNDTSTNASTQSSSAGSSCVETKQLQADNSGKKVPSLVVLESSTTERRVVITMQVMQECGFTDSTL